MTKLHEILAVEKTTQAAAKKLLDESLRTLGKSSLFKGQTRKLDHFSDDDKIQDTVEVQALTTTVRENLEYLKTPWGKWIDVVHSKDVSNMEAKADLLVDGKTIAKDLPASFLLGLESKLADLRNVFMHIPTLAPAIDWVEDPSAGKKGVYRDSNPTQTIKEVKDKEHRIVAPATDRHIAQVAAVDVNRAVGRYTINSQSGMMSPHEKAEILTRLDALLQGVKKARARANDAKVGKSDVGEKLFSFILNGK